MGFWGWRKQQFDSYIAIKYDNHFRILRVNPKLATIHKYNDAPAANLMLEAIVANFPHLTYSILEPDDIEDMASADLILILSSSII